MYREPLLTNRARKLRSEMTVAETRLWWRLRNRQVDGHRFRRQVPIGFYITDFACLGARLVVEVDGDSHGTDVAQARDSSRTSWLESRGWRVLRFWNSYVLEETDEVVRAIRDALDKLVRTPTLPSP